MLPSKHWILAGALEKRKNELFLQIYENQLKQQDSKNMTRNHEINKKHGQIAELNKQIDKKIELIDKQDQKFNYYDKRLKRR